MSRHDAGRERAGRSARDFEEVMREIAVPKRPLIKVAVAIYAWPAVSFGLAVVVRVVCGPVWASVLAVTLVGLVSPGIVRLVALRAGPSRRMRAIDWGTAEDHLRRVADRMSLHALAVISDAREVVRERLEAPRAYVYRTPPDATPASLRRSAAVSVLLGATHPVIVIGDLLTGSVEQLRYVLAHEVTHTTRRQRRARAIWAVAMMWAWALCGLLLPSAVSPVTALAAWAAAIGLAWALEILADLAAARQAGAGAAGWHPTAIKASRSSPLGRRALAAVIPTHPPLRLRAFYTRMILARPRPGMNPR